jgi:hypothetical protein
MKLLGITFVALLIIVASSLLPTALWYCFDNALALLVGIPALGTIAWYHMWAFTMFIMMLLGRSSSSSSKN